jgi:hypothetical protein
MRSPAVTVSLAAIRVAESPPAAPATAAGHVTIVSLHAGKKQKEMVHSRLKSPAISTQFQRPSKGVGKCYSSFSLRLPGSWPAGRLNY